MLGSGRELCSHATSWLDVLRGSMAAVLARALVRLAERLDRPATRE